MLKTLSALAALAVASALVAPTVSQAEEPNSVRVSFADLNLASDVGQHTLQRRITGAARTVCAIEGSRELALASATNACRRDAAASARPTYEAAVASATRHGTVTILDTAAVTVSGR
jgi:UrcA family protein